MSDEKIYEYVERLSNWLRNEARREGGEYGLQPVQLEALHYLAMCNRYSDTPMGVTEYLGQTKGTVSQTLKVLEKKGYINKVADSDDKRVTHLIVTQEGAALLKSTVPPARFSQACHKLDDKVQKKVIEGLKVLLETIQQTNEMKAFGVCRSCRHNKKQGRGQYLCELTGEKLSAADVQLICREYEEAD